MTAWSDSMLLHCGWSSCLVCEDTPRQTGKTAAKLEGLPLSLSFPSHLLPKAGCMESKTIHVQAVGQKFNYSHCRICLYDKSAGFCSFASIVFPVFSISECSCQRSNFHRTDVNSFKTFCFHQSELFVWYIIGKVNIFCVWL